MPRRDYCDQRVLPIRRSMTISFYTVLHSIRKDSPPEGYANCMDILDNIKVSTWIIFCSLTEVVQLIEAFKCAGFLM